MKAELLNLSVDDEEGEAEESVNPFEDAEPKDADTIVKEYANMVKDGHGAEKKGSESGADNKKSPVAKKNKPLMMSKFLTISGNWLKLDGRYMLKIFF